MNRRNVWNAMYVTRNMHTDGLVHERRNSIANALELRLSCTNSSIWFSLCCGLVPAHFIPIPPDNFTCTRTILRLPQRQCSAATLSNRGKWISCINYDLWPILLTWISFNPSMDKKLHATKMWDEIIYPFLNFNGCMWDEIIYPFLNFNGATVEV